LTRLCDNSALDTLEINKQGPVGKFSLTSFEVRGITISTQWCGRILDTGDGKKLKWKNLEMVGYRPQLSDEPTFFTTDKRGKT